MFFNITKQSVIYLIKNINFYFLFFFIYSFCIDVRSNFLVCSFFRGNVVFTDFGIFLFYFLITFLFLFFIFYFLNLVKSNLNYDYLLFLYRNYYIRNISLLALFSYLFNNLRFYFIFFYNIFIKSFIFSFFLEIFSILFNKYYWYPIFKRHSYFGLYRHLRQKWVEVKCEEINRLKY